ncbi:MAG: flagellar capping protein [Lachnospiraceae bacterium]|nr:flagellar capping protein [Lachnospiraceae bacterium]
MISSAYTYYLSQYVGRESSSNRYTTHKKSELRDIYNRMVKSNRRSPLYKIEEPEEAQKYAIDLKEASFALIDVASALEDKETKSGFINKQASSSDNDVAVARYVGEEEPKDDLKEYKLRVSELASPQINIGNYLNSEGRDLDIGSYSFDLNVGEYSYEFQFNVNSNDNNRTVEEKLARLINRSNVGLKAGIIENESGKVALKLESVSSGLSDGREYTFSIKDNDREEIDAVKILGIDKVVTKPSDAHFTVNGIESASPTNTFVINKEFEVTVNSVNADKDVIISFKPDIDAILDNLNTLVSGYNNMIEIAHSKNDGTYENSKLLRDLTFVSGDYRSYLETSGLKVDDEGYIEVDEALVVQAADEGTLTESLEKFSSFKNMLLNRANSISIDPMRYVNKKLISYPNPIKGFSNPYVSSIYSGMMYNGYV